jgi:glycerophosphoryl diester phosphodiesterase
VRSRDTQTSSDGKPLLIAHAYGNTRTRLQTALAAAVDAIELDLWYRNNKLWVRHEKRLDPVPLLVDKRMRGHSLPPLSLPFSKRLYVRLDVNSLKLPEVLHRVSGSKRLLVDLKGSYHAQQNLEFAQTLIRAIREHDAEGWTTVCGQFWPVLEDIRKEAPDIDVRYSIEHVYQWERFMRLVGEDERVRKVCIEHRFLNEERVRYIEEQGVDIFCWTVDDPTEARRLAAAGADGIISNDLELLAALRRGPQSDERPDGDVQQPLRRSGEV